MKQHITIEQLKELSITQQEKLGKWSDKKLYSNKVTLPFLSIGHMIEFLDEYFGKKVYDGEQK